MEPKKCKNCGQEFREWVEFCSNCSEPTEGYSRPAGFWIRFGAQIVDFFVLIPVVVLSYWNTFALKSMIVLVLISVPGLVYKPFMESFFGATLGKMAWGSRSSTITARTFLCSEPTFDSFPFS
ncbi:MAG: RDD family protein [Sedimentisphaerales bacterium]|jgi:hypothetical protein